MPRVGIAEGESHEFGRSVATVTLAFAIMLANNGFIIAGLTSFDSSMLASLDMGIAALKLRDTITIVALGLCVPVTGFLLDRIRVRPIIVTGLVTMAIGFLLYRSVESATQLYVAHIFLGASQGLCGLVAHVVLISRWTSLHRGLALGIVVAGSSLGNALVPAFNGWLLTYWEWRDAILGGALIAVVLIPVVLVVYRESPKRSAEELERAAEPSSGVMPSMSSFALRNFWLLGATAATSVICVLGLAFNLSLYMEVELQQAATRAQWLLFLLFVGSMTAQIIAGLAADRVGPLVVHRTAILLMTVGMVAIVIFPPSALPIAVAIFGFGWGGNSAMLQIQPVALFPTRILGRTLGFLAVLETAGGALAPFLVGYGRDITGSYRAPFVGLCAVMLVSTVCVCLIRRQQAESRLDP